MHEKKKLIFISHAVPGDNYLSGWIASKLSLMGYEVWVDLEDLRSGSAFWNEIELKMRNESIRFLALVSKSYIQKALDKNSGVFSEVALAKVLSKKIDKYVIPLKVDDCDYDDFPINILPLDTIDFSTNWGSGLKKLLKELELQSIPKIEQEDNVLIRWHKYQGIKGEVKKKKETYGSNWFQCTLPKKITAYKFTGDLKKIGKHIPFPFVINGDYCLGIFDDDDLEIKSIYKENILIEKFLDKNMFMLESGDAIKDTESKLVNLMNKVIYNFFYYNDDFRAYSISNKKKVIYPIKVHSKSGYISFTRANKKGRRRLKGRNPVNWSFGLSFIFQLKPFPHYVANHHVLSSNESGFFEQDEQLKYRRSIPSEWYNRHWFERILAFMNLASGLSHDSQFNFQSGRENISIDLRTVSFYSDFGYEES